jgi:hypothetical protein
VVQSYVLNNYVLLAIAALAFLCSILLVLDTTRAISLLEELCRSFMGWFCSDK